MAVFWRLFFAHLLADFTFQTGAVNRWKRASGWGMLLHCATHLAASIILTYPYLNSYWVDINIVKLKGWACVLLIALLHYAEDEWRIFAIKKFRTADGTLHFLWDQFIHAGIIFAFSPVIGFQLNGSFFPEKWAVLGCLFVGVTHALTVFVYFIEKDFYKSGFPRFDEQYLIMAQRVVLWLFFLVPGYGWLPYFFLWLLQQTHLHVLNLM